MSNFTTLSKAELINILPGLKEEFADYKRKKLSLDMSRGKPCPEQLDLSTKLLDILGKDNKEGSGYITREGVDTRNYGGIDGIPEARELFAEMLGVSAEEIIIGGNSSLNMMYDMITRALLLGVPGSSVPWNKLPAVKFLCPSPGYDRHFSICELFGIEMIIIDMLEDGPDMEQIEKLAGEDEQVKGIFCVPKYSNPDGITYADEVVDRLANMQTKAGDFRIFWDDAYSVHHLTDEPDELKNILEACKNAGHPDRVYIFSSTSKITFAGAGIGMMAASEKNIASIKKHISIQKIGPDKTNQLRHVRFFRNMDNIKAHMQKQADIVRPKFELVCKILDEELAGKNIAAWHKPKGGYFISLNTMDGCAREVVEMAAEAGVTLTKAGATFPYGKDPRDRNIRIAPTYPSLEELEKAIKIVCLCLKIVSIEKLTD